MQERKNERAVLMVSFGTSYNESREATIGAIEKAVAKACPDYEIRRAFTSRMIIDKLKKRDGEKIDSVKEAMERMASDGVKEVIVQPTHVMSGFEYEKMIHMAGGCERLFSSVRYGKPLLDKDEDYEQLIRILTTVLAEYDDGKTAIVYMGHGTEHTANVTYEKLKEYFRQMGYSNHFIGTVEAKPALTDTLAEVEKGAYERVILVPLMIVSGDHANNDMAGDEEDSWKMAFCSKGYKVECLLKGMGEYAGVQQMFVDHVKGLLYR